MIARVRSGIGVHSLPACLAVLSLLLSTLVLSRSAHAQALPQISFSTASGAYVASSPMGETITICVATSLDTLRIFANGTNVTSSFGRTTGSCSGGVQYTETGNVTLTFTHDSLSAYVCELNRQIGPDVCTSGSVAFTYTYVEVTPKNGSSSGTIGLPATQQFSVQNLLGTAQTFNLSVACSGSGVSGCSTAGKVRVLANADSTVTVNFTAGAQNTTGTITLTATDSAQTAATDVGSVTYTAQWIPYLTMTTAPMNEDDQDMSRCAMSCFAVTAAVSTVPYISEDAPRGVTLVYHGDRVAVKPFIYTDVTLGAGAPTVQDLTLTAQYKLNGAWIRIGFLNGDTTLHFAGSALNASPGQAFRLGGQFDMSALVNSAWSAAPLRVTVAAVYSTHTEQYTDSSQQVSVVGELHSPIARGWSVAGVGHLYGKSDNSGATLTAREGDGSTTMYVGSCSPNCVWYPPGTGVFSMITFNYPDSLEYIRTWPDSTKEYFYGFGPKVGNIGLRIGRLGDTVVFGYDSLARLVTVSDPYRMAPGGGHAVITLHYNSTYGLASIVEPDSNGNPNAGRVTHVSVGSDSLLRAWTDPDGVSTKFGYDANKRLDSLIDRKGNVTTLAYDAHWKLAQVTSPPVPIDNAGTGSPSSTALTTAFLAPQTIGVPTSATSVASPGPTVLDTATKGTVTDPASHVTTMRMDRWGQPVEVIDPLNLVTRFGGDADGFAETVIYPSGAQDLYSYSGPFLVTSQPAGLSATSYSYGAFGQLTSISGAGQPTQTLFPGKRGHIDSVTVAGSTWRYYADAHLRDVLVVDPRFDSTRYTYDTIAPSHPTASGNLDSTIAWPSYRFTARTFDGHGRTHTVSVSTPSGPTVVTTTAYDSVNRVVTATDGLHSTPTRFTYDSLFNTVIRDPLGQPYHYAYNALGWDTTETDTSSRTLRATYNNLGAPTTNTNRRKQPVQTLYDSHGRDSIVTRPSSEPDNVDHFRYPDAYTVVDSNSVVKDLAYVSQTTGLIDSMVTYFVATTHRFKRAYTHDALGRVTKVVITPDTAVKIAFNARATGYNDTTGLIDSLDISSSSNRLTFGYDSLFRLTSVKYPNNVVRNDAYFTSGQLNYTEWDGLSPVIARIYGYDSTGHVNEMDYNGILRGDTAALFTYDVLGELTQRQLIKWTDTATSCPGTQLQNGFGCRYGSSRTDTVLQTAKYSYDAAGNLDTIKVGSADTVASISTGNRSTGWTGLTFAVDSDGNRTSTTVGSQTTNYTWGADGRLLGVTQGSNTRSYDYDPSGQLVQRKTNGTVDRYYLWDNGQILAILDGTATHRIAEFVYFGGVDQPLARITGATTTDTIHYYAQDALGNVIAQFQGTTIEQSLAYDPWGATTLSSHPDSTQLRWKGLLYEDGITSLYYMRARWYDPVTRRFVSPDPLGLSAGVNPYAYAGGDPIDGGDPSGLCKAGEIQTEGATDAGGVEYHGCSNADGVFLYYETNANPGVPYIPVAAQMSQATTTAQRTYGPLPLGAAGFTDLPAQVGFYILSAMGGGGGSFGASPRIAIAALWLRNPEFNHCTSPNVNYTQDGTFAGQAAVYVVRLKRGMKMRSVNDSVFRAYFGGVKIIQNSDTSTLVVASDAVSCDRNEGPFLGFGKVAQ